MEKYAGEYRSQRRTSACAPEFESGRWGFGARGTGIIQRNLNASLEDCDKDTCTGAERRKSKASVITLLLAQVMLNSYLNLQKCCHSKLGQVADSVTASALCNIEELTHLYRSCCNDATKRLSAGQIIMAIDTLRQAWMVPAYLSVSSREVPEDQLRKIKESWARKLGRGRQRFEKKKWSVCKQKNSRKLRSEKRCLVVVILVTTQPYSVNAHVHPHQCTINL